MERLFGAILRSVRLDFYYRAMAFRRGQIYVEQRMEQQFDAVDRDEALAS